MQYFLDSANVPLIAKTLQKYPIDGVTTNPAIISRDLPADSSLAECLMKIRALIKDKLMFVQTTSADTDGMIRDAYKIFDVIGGNLSIKIPATPDGFAAMKKLSAEKICVTATAVYTTSQAMLAAKAGAYYAAPYISHIDNLSLDGARIAIEMAEELRSNGMNTQILAASFRTAEQIDRVIRGGVTSVTVTAEMFDILASHPGTMQELSSFGDKWNTRFGRGISELLDE
jgi:fructose-6-phosphate aldolase 2